jgi:hypothetical protein
MSLEDHAHSSSLSGSISDKGPFVETAQCSTSVRYFEQRTVCSFGIGVSITSLYFPLQKNADH